VKTASGYASDLTIEIEQTYDRTDIHSRALYAVAELVARAVLADVAAERGAPEPAGELATMQRILTDLESLPAEGLRADLDWIFARLDARLKVVPVHGNTREAY
jgi:hypothetical protein